ARFVPMETARVVARPTGGPTERHARGERIAREAVKQCGRVVVPAVGATRALGGGPREIPEPDASWVFWGGGGRGVAAPARETGAPARMLLLVGPEGGFTPEEIVQAERAGARIVSLGPRILRAESAGLTAVALCQFLFGDLGASTSARGAESADP